MNRRNNFHGSALSFPFAADERGTLRTVSDPAVMARQFLVDVLQTRKGERVMLPDYGVTDPTFAVVDAGFSERLALELEEQVQAYLPIISGIRVDTGSLDEDSFFMPGFTLDRQRVALRVTYIVAGSNTPNNLVIPFREFNANG